MEQSLFENGKRRAGIKEAEELGLDEFRDGLYNLFIKGKITEEQFIAWGNDYEAYLEGDKTEKPPFAAEDFDKEISFIEKKYTKEQLRDLLNANYHKRTFPDKIWEQKHTNMELMMNYWSKLRLENYQWRILMKWEKETIG